MFLEDANTLTPVKAELWGVDLVSPHLLSSPTLAPVSFPDLGTPARLPRASQGNAWDVVIARKTKATASFGANPSLGVSGSPALST